MMRVRLVCDVFSKSSILDHCMRVCHLQHMMKLRVLSRTVCLASALRKDWAANSELGPDLIEMDDDRRNKHYKRNQFNRDRRYGNHNYDESYRDRDRLNYNRRNQFHKRENYNYGLEGKAKYTSRLQKRVESQGEFLFGLRPVLFAMKEGRRTIYKVYVNSRMQDNAEREHSNPLVQEIIDLAEERNVPIEWCSKAELNFMSYQRPHQGVVIDASKLTYLSEPESEIECKKEQNILPRLCLVLSSVQDPMNLGGILRTAYYLGTENIVAYNSCNLSPVVSKASAGAMELFDIYETKDIHQFVYKQKEQGKFIFGSVGEDTTLQGPQDENMTIQPSRLSDTTLTKDSLLLIGNEGEGLSEDVLHLCDELITIPEIHQPSGKDIGCLNVSAATAIMQYHLLSSRKLRRD